MIQVTYFLTCGFSNDFIREAKTNISEHKPSFNVPQEFSRKEWKEKSELPVAKMVKQRHIDGYETHPQVMYVQ